MLISLAGERIGGYPRFHTYYCKKIEEMHNQGRKHRYKASGKKDGKFFLIKEKEEWYEALNICSYCLTLYNQQFKSDKTKKNFPYEEWITSSVCDPNLPKVELDFCTIPNCYTDSWSQISNKRKEQEKYKCQNCYKNFEEKICRKFLQTHHIDANKRNNTKENLKVLCIACHSKEPYHGHIKQNPVYKEWLKSKCFKIHNK